MSATFQSLNRNKRSVVVDLKDAAERESLRTAHRRAGGCRHPEPAARLGGGVRPRCRVAARAQACAGLLHHRRLRRRRPAQGPSRLRSLDAGVRRPHERDRGAGPASGPGRHLDHRHGGGHVVGDRRARRAAAAARRRHGRRDRHLALSRRCSAGCATTPPISRPPASAEAARIGRRDDRAVSRLRDEGRFHRHRRRQRQAVCVAGAGSRPPGMDRRTRAFAPIRIA